MRKPIGLLLGDPYDFAVLAETAPLSRHNDSKKSLLGGAAANSGTTALCRKARFSSPRTAARQPRAEEHADTLAQSKLAEQTPLLDYLTEKDVQQTLDRMRRRLR